MFLRKLISSKNKTSTTDDSGFILPNIITTLPTKKDEDEKDNANKIQEILSEPLEVNYVNVINQNLPKKALGKPLYGDNWIKCIDTQNQIYYFNSKTGESNRLAPCFSCFKPSNKWCMDCQASYCDHHFKKVHKSNKSFHNHIWNEKETNVIKPILKDTDVYCIECNLNIATVMCVTCWDAYCHNCLSETHYVGDLLHHQTKPYELAKQGWIKVQHFGTEDDFYIHGDSEETTYEKPVELMNEFELSLLEALKEQERTTQENLDIINKLQYDVEKAKYERLKVISETAHALQEIQGHITRKQQEKEASQNTILLDNQRIKELSTTMFDSVMKNHMELNMYKDKLLTPDDRPRGANRTQYIEDVLRETVGTVSIPMTKK